MLAAAVTMTAGCAASAPPPVSDKVADYYEQNKSLPAASQAAAPTVAFIGDSYTAGAGTSTPSQRWTTRLSVGEGLKEVNLGQGGTGYLMTNTTPEGQVRPNYRAMIARAVKAKPAVVVVSGGGNDMALDLNEVQAAVRDFYPALRKALPKATIIAVNPLWGATTPPAGLDALQQTVQDGVEGVDGTFLDIGQPLIKHPELVIADKIHPNDAGAGVIAEATRQAWRKSPAAASLPEN